MWKIMINQTFILRSLKGLYHSHQFRGQIGELGLPQIYVSQWNFKKDYNATPTSAFIAAMVLICDRNLMSSDPATLDLNYINKAIMCLPKAPRVKNRDIQPFFS